MPKILLAEDDNDMRRFLVKALENAGFQVSSHDNGMAAYQRLREEPFEMLLTDIVMPEMDGIELARRASELDPDIKIMFITGFAAVALNSDSDAPKNAKVLSKPVHLRELVERSEQDAGGLNRPRSVLAPAPPSRYRDPTRRKWTIRARSSAGEHYLDMVGVTGSIPVAPTTLRLRSRGESQADWATCRPSPEGAGGLPSASFAVTWIADPPRARDVLRLDLRYFSAVFATGMMDATCQPLASCT